MMTTSNRKRSVALCCLFVMGAFVLIVPVIASISPTELEATLHPCESITEIKEVHVDKPARADVVFAFDLTGSMGGIIDTAKTNAASIIAELDALGVDVQYGVMSYMDYPDSYESCGYSAEYGTYPCGGGDYAYRLDQSVTSDSVAVVAAIEALVLGCGGDGPQDYTRIFYESYADSSVGWRSDAKRILVNFGDDVPHDCDLNEGVTGGTWSTGGDPGRDEVMGTADDLDLQTVLAEMAANGVTLLECHTSTYASAHWDYWTGITGGDVYITSSATLVDDVVEAVEDALVTPMVYGLHLEASSGFESWLEAVDPESYPEVEPCNTVTFTVTIHVPLGTEEGEYTFTISAVDADGVSYGDQTVTITVIVNRPPDCSGAYADPGCLWPPNHKMVPVSILGVTDPDGNPVSITITDITSDEPTASDKGSGGAKHAPDADGVGTDTAIVRAERSGLGNGRVYTILFAASDGEGGECEGSVTVCVPHDQSGECECVDDGQIYDATDIN